MPSLATLLERPGLDETALVCLKALIALAALLALLHEADREQRGRPVALRWKKQVAAVFALLGVVAYFQFFQVGSSGFFHRWDFFQTYLGAKYHHELARERFYGCVAVAEAELPDGSAAPSDHPSVEVRKRRLRDLTTMQIVEASEWVDQPGRCKVGFAGPGGALDEARWGEFRGDVAFFRRTMRGKYWGDAQRDFGYGMTPAWLLLAWPLTLVPLSAGWCQALAGLDVALMAATLGLISWAFGWRIFCLAAVFWGTQLLWPFSWMGGAFLRQEWVFLLVASVCMIRRRRWFVGGALLMAGGLTRVLPLLFFAGPLVLLAAGLLRRDGSWRGLARFFAGALVAGALTVGATTAHFSKNAWLDWLAYLGKVEPSQLANKVGWRTVVALDPAHRMVLKRTSPDPYTAWAQARRRTIERRRWALHGGQLLALAAFAAACWRTRRLWISVALGSTLVFWFFDGPTYFSAHMMVLPLLVAARPRLQAPLLLAALMTAGYALSFDWYDERFGAMSSVALALVVTCVGAFLSTRPARPSRASAFTRQAAPYRQAPPA